MVENIFTTNEAEKLWNVLLKLEKFRYYKQGWNGYDADPFSDKLISYVREAIIIDLDVIPEIFPVADGSIQLEYDQDDKHLEFQIYEDKHMAWYYMEGVMDQEGTCPKANSTLINQCVKGVMK